MGVLPPHKAHIQIQLVGCAQWPAWQASKGCEGCDKHGGMRGVGSTRGRGAKGGEAAGEGERGVNISESRRFTKDSNVSQSPILNSKCGVEAL